MMDLSTVLRRARGLDGGVAPEEALTRGLFAAQRRLWDSQELEVAVCCSRRAGKTNFVGRWLMHRAGRYPGADNYTGYLTTTQGVSLRNLDGVIRDLVQTYHLPFVRKSNKNQEFWEHRNGHRIWLGGVDDMRKVERYRGNFWRGFVLDEAQSFPNDVLEYLVEDILHPALSDHRAPLRMCGTPGRYASGYWHSRCTGLGDYAAWPLYHWTLLDNPHHVAHAEGGAFLDSERRRLGWDPKQETAEAWDSSHPAFQREWLGLWVEETKGRIYHFSLDKNGFAEPPRDRPDPYLVLSIDVGRRDKTALTVSMSHRGWGDLWFLESVGKPNMLLGQLAAEISRLKIKYGEFDQIVVDPAGGGLAHIQDLANIYGIHVKGAKKSDKAAGIRMIQDGMERGVYHFHPFFCAPLLGEMALLTWDKKRSDHNPDQPDDCCDSAIYGAREHDLEEAWERMPPDGREAVEATASSYEEGLRRAQAIRNSGLSPLQKRRALAALGVRA